jgi:biotin operon repressor
MKLDRRIYTGILVARELTKNPENFASAREIAEKLGLPEIPVRQALLRLRRAGILQAEKGRQGEYRLAKAPEKIPSFPCSGLWRMVIRFWPCFRNGAGGGSPIPRIRRTQQLGFGKDWNGNSGNFLRTKPSPIYANLSY